MDLNAEPFIIIVNKTYIYTYIYIIPSKYKPKPFNCNMFSKISPVAKYPIASVYKHYVLYKKYIREFFNTFLGFIIGYIFMSYYR